MLTRHPLAVALVAALLAQALFALLGVTPILAGDMIDSDCYSRLARVLQLHQGGAWFDGLDPRVNAPYGETLQWTRPLDVLIELVAEPLGLAMPFKRALTLAGALVSPALLLATLAVLWHGWGARLGPRRFLLLVLLFHLSPSLISAYLVGYPDHHSLLALLFLSQWVAILRVVEGASPRWSALAGAVGGVALWVSLESAVAQALFGVALAGLWLGRRAAAAQVAAFATALAVSTTLAIGIEFPPALWPVEAYDRISVVHASLLGLTAAGWCGIAAWPRLAERAGGGARLAATLLCGAALAVATLALFPKLLSGPFVDHGEVARAWLSTVSEWQPLWPTNRQRAASLLAELGSLLVVVPWLLRRLRARGAKAAEAALHLAGIAVFVGAALTAVRWASYAQAVVLLPWTLAVAEIAASPRILWGLPVRRVGAVLAMGCGLVLAGAVSPGAAAPGKVGRPSAASATCPLQPLAARLQGQLVPASGRPPLLMTYLFIGPELEWRTGLDLVGIPSANEATILDTRTVLGGGSDAEALAVARRRRIDYLLICPSSQWAEDFRAPGGVTLHQRLERGETPDWLSPVPLPQDLGDWRLFRVAAHSMVK